MCAPICVHAVSNHRRLPFSYLCRHVAGVVAASGVVDGVVMGVGVGTVEGVVTEFCATDTPMLLITATAAAQVIRN